MVAHNGKLTQCNAWYLQFDGGFPLLNHFRNTQQWDRSAGAASRYDPAKHDANGYPHTIYGSGLYNVGHIPTAAQRPGNYVFKWTGRGQWLLNGDTLLSGSLDNRAGGVNGRAVLSFNTGDMSNVLLNVGTDGVDYPTDVVFCHEDDEALIDDGYVFSELFKSKAANFACWRSINWQPVDCNVINWADRMPLTHYSWSATMFPSAKYAGVTSNTGDAFTVAKSGFTLTDKAQVIVKWNATSGVSPTIDIEGTGAVPVRSRYGGLLGAAEVPTTNFVSCLTYEERLGCYLKHGSATEDEGISHGMPVEAIIQFCREIGADPWFIPPYLSLDPLSDYMPSLAQLCKDTLNA